MEPIYKQSRPFDGSLAELEASQCALDRRITALENSLIFRTLRAVSRPFLDWRTKFEYAIRFRLPRNPLARRLERREADLYRQWLARTAPIGPSPDQPNPPPAAQSGPLFTLILRADETNRKWVRSAVESLVNQTWPHWELLIAPRVASEAGDLPADSRIRTCADNETGSGDYIGILDSGVLLAPHALQDIAEALGRGGADIIYSDSDHLNPGGQRERPVFRPGWSPDLAASPLYPGAFYLTRAGFSQNGGLEDSPACGLHIPRLLYHSRLAVAGAPKPRPPHRVMGNPLASIIICSRTPRLLQRCLRSIDTRTAWMHREVIVVHHLGGDDAAMEKVVRSANAIRVPFEGAFNFALMNNLGARAAHGEILNFLNDDVQPLTPLWLESLIAQVQRPRVGIAGAKLLYPSGLIQHAGIAYGIGDACGHLGRYTLGSVWFPWFDFTRDLSAVTAACLAIRRRLFEELGGFDSRSFPINYNDVDLCLRSRAAGFRVIYEPAAVLRHDECQTRRSGTEFHERRQFFVRWGDTVAAGDPFYSPNLTSLREDAAL